MSHTAIISGIPWLDDDGSPVNAHGSCLVHEGGRFYLFGEYKTDDENRFVGFSCYSSPDLVNWHFERLALPPQAEGLLGPGRIGERVKVMRCPTTGVFVMLAHSDDLTYTDPVIALAVSDTVDGEYVPVGALTHDGEPIRRWDMGTFQDDDGTGYLLLHEGDIYRLAEDYLSAVELVARDVAPGGESPAMMRSGGTYFLMLSHKTAWDRNDNYYLSAPDPHGPWTRRGSFAPEGSATWNSQCSFIYRHDRAGRAPVHVYTGDRWSFPHQASAGTYVWQPLIVEGERLSLPRYLEAWDPSTGQAVSVGGQPSPVAFTSDSPGDTLSVPVSVGGAASRLAVRGRLSTDGGYARIRTLDGHRRVVADQLVDCYAPVPAAGLLYVGAPLPAGEYELTVEVTGEASVFFKKDGTRLGSSGIRVTVDALGAVP